MSAFNHRESCLPALGKIADKAKEKGKAETRRYYAERLQYGNVVVLDKSTGRETVVLYGSSGEAIVGIPAN